jgi:hypothetical protein
MLTDELFASGSCSRPTSQVKLALGNQNSLSLTMMGRQSLQLPSIHTRTSQLEDERRCTTYSSA